MSAEEAAALRKKRRNKTGPGTTRSGRKDSVMSQGMRLSMAHATGESMKGYQMEAAAEGTESQENSPKPPARTVAGEEAGAADATAGEAGAAEAAAVAAPSVS